jgi:hypothetical protein
MIRRCAAFVNAHISINMLQWQQDEAQRRSRTSNEVVKFSKQGADIAMGTAISTQRPRGGNDEKAFGFIYQGHQNEQKNLLV